MIKRERPDVLLLDITLPDRSGFDVLDGDAAAGHGAAGRRAHVAHRAELCRARDRGRSARLRQQVGGARGAARQRSARSAAASR